MKYCLRLLSAAALATLPLVSNATVFFNDTFSNGSTLNQPPVAATINSASYQTAIGTTNNVTIPSISADKLTIVFPNAGSVLGETFARFTPTPITLVEVGDYIDLTVVFVNTSNILSEVVATTLNNNASLNIGLFNSYGVNPNQGQFQLANTASQPNLTGGTEDWQGYFSRIFRSGNSTTLVRSNQTPAATSQNQDLLFTGASGSQAFNNPAAIAFGGNTASNVLLPQGSTNTLLFRVTLSALGTHTISNALFAGEGTGGTVLFSQQKTTTAATFVTTSFDGLAIGWRNSMVSPASQGSAMTIQSILVTGQSTVDITPPEIVTEPVSIVVPAGAAGPFTVVAQGGGSLNYQWKRYGTNLINGGNISGATSATLVISPVSAADVAAGANGYFVTVSDAGGSTNSITNSLTLGTAKNLVWSGSGNVWDLNNSANWLNGVTPATFNYGDAVTFDDTGAGNPVVTLDGNFLSASKWLVTGNTAYAFGGSGRLAGNGSLVLNSAAGGSIQLNVANTHTGGTIVSNDNPALNIYIQQYQVFGSGPVILAKSGLMEIVPAGSATLGINGNVAINDDFTIQYDGSGAFATVFLGNLSGTAGKTLTLNPVSLTTTNRIRVYGTATTCDANLIINGPVTSYAAVDGTTFAPYHGSGSQTYNGVISGNGGIIQRAGGTTVLSAQNTYAGGTIPTTGTIGFGADSTPTSGPVTSGPLGTGALIIAPELGSANGSGTVLAWGGARTIANPLQYPSATNNQTLIIGGSNALTFSGPFTLNGNDGTGTQTNRIIQVNNTNTLTTISGVISGLGFTLTKTGPGTLALTGNNTYDGLTAISNGTLRVNGTLAGPTLVTANSTLEGTGTIGGATTILAGGIISPGNSIGTLTINNNLSIAGNLRMEINRSGSSADRVNVSGTLANTGTGTVTVTNLGAALQAGDTFALFNKAVTGGNTLTITGGGSSVSWTNKLAVDGTIAVLSVIPTTPTNITYSVSGNSLTLNWPANYQGWLLQSNSVGLTSSSSWFTVPNSGNASQFVVPIDPAKPSVFYRLTLP